MKPGIDTYCFHRFFGDWYAELQRDPGRRLTPWQMLDHCASLGVAGVSVESCYLPRDEPGFAPRLRDALAAHALDCVWAWGHPDGLASGAAPAALDDLIAEATLAASCGARVMRICAGSRRTRPEAWATHRAALLPLLRRAAAAGERHGVVLAIENHIDLFADELLDLLTAIGSPFLGVCLDTANQIRIGEDNEAAMRKLAPWTRATHVKDVARLDGAAPGFASWPAVPIGAGVVDLPAVFADLRAAGYAGLLAVEIDYLHPRYGEDELAALAASVGAVRALLAAA
jgi:sugar phosphate isomerase/epimerase